MHSRTIRQAIQESKCSQNHLRRMRLDGLLAALLLSAYAKTTVQATAYGSVRNRRAEEPEEGFLLCPDAGFPVKRIYLRRHGS